MRSEPSTGTGDPAGSEPIWRTVTKRLPTALTLLAATLALAGVVVAGTGAVAADGTAELDENTVTVSENGTAEIAVESDGIESFEVVIGDEDQSGYELRATVTPDGGGVTALVLDHAETGENGAPLTADGDAAVDIDHETALKEAIAPGSYDVKLFVGDGSEPVDVGTLMVETTERDGGTEDAVDAVTENVEDADVLIEPRATVVTVPVEIDDGASVEVRLRSAGDASTDYIKTREATVTDGEATATFNASVADPGDRATLTVRGNEGLDEPVTREVLVVENVDSPESGDTWSEAPGFGLVAAALALLGAALVARVRG